LLPDPIFGRINIFPKNLKKSLLIDYKGFKHSFKALFLPFL
jgi:hypothetical protein